MKWKSTYKRPPYHGEIRKLPRFLIIPIWLDGYWYWLERVYKVQYYEKKNWADSGWNTIGYETQEKNI